MQFINFVLIVLPTFSLALPAASGPTAATDSNAAIQNYLDAADSTMHQLSIFQCKVAECVEALAPLLAACAIAAASEGRDTAEDATCVADAYQDLAPSKKPAECAHCYN